MTELMQEQSHTLEHLNHIASFLLQNSSDTVIICDFTYTIIFTSPEHPRHLITQDNGSLIGNSLFTFFSDNDKSTIQIEINKLLKDPNQTDSMFKIRENTASINITISNNLNNEPETILFLVKDVIQKDADFLAKTNQNRLELALEGADLGLWDWDISSGEVYFNDRFLKKLGYNRDEISHNYEFFEQIIHPQDRTSVMEELLSHLNGETEQYESEYRIITRYGSVFWILNRGKIVKNEQFYPLRISGTFLDVTNRKRMEEKLKESEERYRGLFHSLPIGLFRISPSGYILEANNAAINLLNFPSIKELLEHPVLSFIPHPKIRELLKVLYRNDQELHTLELPLFRYDQVEIWIKAYVRQVTDNGTLLYFEGSFMDITQEREALELKQAKEKAETENRAKSEFLANMSHEIRTPMNAILGFSEMLNLQLIDPKQKNFIQAIQSSGKNLLKLINDILDLSKIEAGKFNLQKIPTALFYLIQDLENIFSLKIAEKGLALHIEIEPDLPGSLLLDEVRLRQILFNLMGNAIKFTQNGYIKLIVQTFDQVDEELTLQLKVIDTGIGIPQKDIHKIFEAFKQQDGQSTKKYGGTGLGLTITQRLVEMMDGTISVESTPDVGSTFSINLKHVSIIDQNPLEQIIQTNNTPPNLNCIFYNQTILLVDDHPLNHQLIQEYLQGRSLNIIEAESGEAAIKIARGYHPDLILMDLKMPGMSGYEATRILKEHPDTKDIPIVAITASAMKREQLKLEASYFNHYILKPVDQNDLLKLLKEFLRHKTIQPNQIETSPKQLLPKLSDDGITMLPTLLIQLNTVYQIQINNLKNTGMIDEIINLGETLKEVAINHHNPPLTQYAEKLIEHGDNFDIEQINKTLKEFDTLLNQLTLISTE